MNTTRERGISDAQALEEIGPASAGQHHVGDEHVDLPDVGDDRFGLLGRRRLIHAMAGALEDDTREVSHGFLVFDDEHGGTRRVVGQRDGLDAWRQPLMSGIGNPGQIDTKGRSLCPARSPPRCNRARRSRSREPSQAQARFPCRDPSS